MDAFTIIDECGVFTEEDYNKIEALPEQHKGAIFLALDKHFAKYDDLIKNQSSTPSKADL